VAHFGAGLVGCEHPFDAGGDGVVLLLPDGSLDGQLLETFDAAVKALGRQHADLDFHHVQPAGMFGDVVELQSAQQASCFLSRECLVERAGGVSGQIIEDDADARGPMAQAKKR
jgi:hypothetical protein